MLATLRVTFGENGGTRAIGRGYVQPAKPHLRNETRVHRTEGYGAQYLRLLWRKGALTKRGMYAPYIQKLLDLNVPALKLTPRMKKGPTQIQKPVAEAVKGEGKGGRSSGGSKKGKGSQSQSQGQGAAGEEEEGRKL